ncbi:MAG: hypothetical protein ACRED9_14070 [Caulobacteraceae bacterium]
MLNSTAWTRGALALGLLLALSACVAGSAESAHTATTGGDVAVFFLGLWHGIIAPIMLIIEVINRIWPHTLPWSVRFYEVKAARVVYDVGFYIGLAGGPSFLFGGWRWRR